MGIRHDRRLRRAILSLIGWRPARSSPQLSPGGERAAVRRATGTHRRAACASAWPSPSRRKFRNGPRLGGEPMIGLAKKTSAMRANVVRLYVEEGWSAPMIACAFDVSEIGRASCRERV